jgi:MFS family permease
MPKSSLDLSASATPAAMTATRTRLPLYVSTFLYWTALYLYAPILAPYTEYQGGTIEIVGLVIGAYGLAQFLLRLPVGIACDRLGRRKPFLALGFLTAIAAALGFILAPAPWFLVGARFLSGISACAWVAFTVLFASYFPNHQTMKAMGYLAFCNSIAVMSASYIGGLLADTYGWAAPFWAAVGVGVVGLLSTPLVHEQPQRQYTAQPLWQRLRSVVRYRELLLATGITALGQFTFYATTFGFVASYAISIGASKTQLGLLALLATLAQSLAALVSGAGLARYLGPRQTVVLSYLFMAAGTVAVPYLDTVGALYATQLLVGFGRGAPRPILMSFAIARLPEGERATAMGFFQGVYAAGMFAGPALSGFIGSSTGYAGIFLVSAAMALLTASLSLRLPR